jgi:hypothetical protein
MLSLHPAHAQHITSKSGSVAAGGGSCCCPPPWRGWHAALERRNSHPTSCLTPATSCVWCMRDAQGGAGIYRGPIHLTLLPRLHGAARDAMRLVSLTGQFIGTSGTRLPRTQCTVGDMKWTVWKQAGPGGRGPALGGASSPCCCLIADTACLHPPLSHTGPALRPRLHTEHSQCTDCCTQLQA